jgi:hypothetical protein
MFSANLQHFIDQHPMLFVAIFPFYFIIIWLLVGIIWLLVGAINSYVGGWFSLARVYRTRMAFNGARWKMQSGQMRWLANYNNMLTFGVSRQVLYLASMFLFRFMHPPLLIPWSEIKVRRSKGWCFEYVTFTLGHELAIPLRVRGRLAAKLSESADKCWPIEET